MSNAINWFEIPSEDFDRAVKFYETILDIQMHREEMCGATLAFFPMEEGSVSGAVIKYEMMKPSDHGVLVYLNGGEDLTTVLDKIEGAGGKVVAPKTKITDEIGYFAIFHDTEGNQVALHSPK